MRFVCRKGREFLTQSGVQTPSPLTVHMEVKVKVTEGEGHRQQVRSGIAI